MSGPASPNAACKEAEHISIPRLDYRPLTRIAFKVAALAWMTAIVLISWIIFDYGFASGLYYQHCAEKDTRPVRTRLHCLAMRAARSISEYVTPPELVKDGIRMGRRRP
jgi:hypothetical protein